MIDAMKIRSFEILTQKGASGEIYFVLDGTSGLRVRRINLPQTLQSEISDKVIGAAYFKLAQSEATSLLDVTQADDRASVIYRYDMEDVPATLSAMKKAMQGGDGNFDYTVDSIGELEAIVIVVGSATNKMAIYQHHYPVNVVRRGSSFNIFKPGNVNSFQEVPGDIVKIGLNVHFALIEEEIYVLDLKLLERMYGFRHAIENVAREAVQQISGANLIDATDFFEERKDDLPFKRKLAQAARKPLVLGRVPNDQIIEFVSNHSSLGKRIKISTDGTKLILATKSAQNSFLKLLTDNFLRSELTQNQYESRAKDQIA
ncbi:MULTISPECIES: anti-phage protein KwaB [Xanthomonas]|uniref:anti-phage protein KwaB n=1 Tax=Xanthomonas TaxID=338 RepID=UPI0006FF36A4|nr:MULTISPECIES: anti-phage protein KwaB [Xanthomonas]KQR09047.1 hypothetical protein ASF90_16020 [Xanthomonas sp. Leaf148]